MHSVESIRDLLETNDRAVVRAIIKINSLKDGFRSKDAQYGSYLASFARNNGFLDGKFLDHARKMMFKYAEQLANIANETAGLEEKNIDAVEIKYRIAEREAIKET